MQTIRPTIVMTPDEEPALPPGMRDLMEHQEQFGGFLVMQRVTDTEYAYLLGGLDKVLLREAASCADRSRLAADANDLSGEAGSACAAILAAAAACEARLSEYLAHEDCMGDGLSEELKNVRRNPNAREQWKDLLRIRRPAFVSGSSREFGALGCLYKLRDLVAHRFAQLSMPEALPDSIVDCVRQRLIPSRRRDGAEWTTALFVHEVAAWAAETGNAWVELVDRELPIHC